MEYEPPSSSVTEVTPDPASRGDRSELDVSLTAIAKPLGTNLAELASQLGDRQMLYRSIQLVEQAVDRNPEDSQLETQLADAYVATGEDLPLAQAISIYRSQLVESPQEGALLARLADAYQQLGNHEDTITFATQRAQLPSASDRQAGSLQIALITLESGETTRGVKVLESLYLDHPDDHVLALLIASLMFQDDRSDDARNLLNRLVDSLPEDHTAAIKARSILTRHATEVTESP